MGYAFNRGIEIISIGGLGLSADFIAGQFPGPATVLAGGVLAYSAFVDTFEYKQGLSDDLKCGRDKLKNYL